MALCVCVCVCVCVCGTRAAAAALLNASLRMENIAPFVCDGCCALPELLQSRRKCVCVCNVHRYK